MACKPTVIPKVPLSLSLLVTPSQIVSLSQLSLSLLSLSSRD